MRTVEFTQTHGCEHWGAEFTPGRRFRFKLWRLWDYSKPFVQVIGLNPSKADEKTNDSTVARIMTDCKAWGYGGLYMTNAFPIVSPHPRVMKRFYNRNDRHELKIAVDRWNYRTLMDVQQLTALHVAAWGNDGAFRGQSELIRASFPNLHCYRLTSINEPWHRLYLPFGLKPFPLVNERKI